MSNNAYYKLYYHVVWATKSHEIVIKPEQIKWTTEIVIVDAKKRCSRVIACGIMPDHVHLLVSLPPTIAIATFVGQVKGSSAHLFNKTVGKPYLKWQEGYGALTLRESDVDKVANYVNNQQKIHASRKPKSVLEICSSPLQGA